MQVSIQVISTTQELAMLRIQWDDLLRSSDYPCPFRSWNWQYTWWETLGTGRPYVLAMKSAGQLIGLAPLYLRTGLYKHCLPLRALRFLGDESVGSDYLDFIIAQGREDEFYTALYRHLTNARGWDILDLRGISSDSVSLYHLGQWYQSRTMPLGICPYLQLSANKEDLNFNSASFRSLIQRKERKARRDLAFEHITHPKPIPGLIEKLVALNRLRLSEKQISGAFLDPKFSTFHRQALPRLMHSQQAWLESLELNGQTAAMLYMLRGPMGPYYYQIGWGPHWQRYSPGHLILSQSIYQAASQGHSRYDLLRGDEGFKLSWAKHSSTLVNARFFNTRGLARPLGKLFGTIPQSPMASSSEINDGTT